MPDRRRLTVSLVVTGTVADEIDGLRRALGAGSLQRIAPHVTLVPPLNVKTEHLSDVLDHVRLAARRSGPLAVELGPPATFWPRTPVLYLEVRGDIAKMGGLRERLVAGPLAPPAARRERAFVPHLTLDQRIEPGRLQAALAAFASYRRTYCFERLTVLEQQEGHRWWPMADAPLGGPAVVGRGSLDLEFSVVDRPDPVVAAWADGLWDRYREERYGSPPGPRRPYAIVARSGGELVGFAEGETKGPVARLGRLIVSPRWRDKGIGSHLLRAVERLAAEHGCGRVRLEAPADEEPERFYGERGYKVTARLPAWNEGRDFVVMERTLSPLDPGAS